MAQDGCTACINCTCLRGHKYFARVSMFEVMFSCDFYLMLQADHASASHAHAHTHKTTSEAQEWVCWISALPTAGNTWCQNNHLSSMDTMNQKDFLSSQNFLFLCGQDLVFHTEACGILPFHMRKSWRRSNCPADLCCAYVAQKIVFFFVQRARLSGFMDLFTGFRLHALINIKLQPGFVQGYFQVGLLRH